MIQEAAVKAYRRITKTPFEASDAREYDGDFQDAKLRFDLWSRPNAVSTNLVNPRCWFSYQ